MSSTDFNRFLHMCVTVPESPVILLRARLLTMVVEFDGSISGRSTLPAQQRIRLTALIKLYCGLVGLLKLKLEGEEMNAILSLLTKVKDERYALTPSQLQASSTILVSSSLLAANRPCVLCNQNRQAWTVLVACLRGTVAPLL